ncbi:MAG: glycosyltransferase family 4 protein [Propionibacterium sp.]|nr:glycosyltransferase family 4 protein [Propionibacterium sp.]
MHVVMVTNSVAPDKLGGLERYVRDLSGRLVGYGLQVTVISKCTDDFGSDDQFAEDGVRILRYAAPSKRDPLFAVKYAPTIRREVSRLLADALRTSGGAVIHGHFPVPMSAVLSSKRPYVYTFHAPVHKEIVSERQASYLLPPFVESMAVSGMRRAETRVLASAATVFTLSQFTADEARMLVPGIDSRHVLVPGGIDTGVFSPGSISIPQIRHALGTPLLFTARRLVERTGVEELVKAMPQILVAQPETHLYIAGEGPRREAIERQRQRLGLDRQVTLLGRIPEADLVDWYRRADVAVTPTKALEGFGLSTAEALACGTPAFVTPVGANAEVVRGLDPTLVAPAASAEGIASGLIALWRHPERLERIAASARDYASTRFGWDAICARHIDVYQKQLGVR